ncbi:hypothetical protein [Lactobacillus sp. ESL0681]|uniref:hypothetical protein n=1 Tax=Lactobacillus sp. ESL0681 TaxID=2983211 RepID=UPI0023F7EA4B|nr:hypothetical protein [Lactobacillus sp. ESL0681]WEV41053.1 hypothetical protein OZX59_03800 [Lactobacillus sp. ESL0681]
MKTFLSNFFKQHQLVSTMALISIITAILDIIRYPKLAFADLILGIVIAAIGFLIEPHIKPVKQSWSELFIAGGFVALYLLSILGAAFLIRYLFKL